MPEEAQLESNQGQPAEAPSDAYKSLQRKLEASRRRERALMEQTLAQVEIQAQLEALTVGNQAVLKVLEKSGLIEEDEFPQAGGARVPPEASSARREIAQSLFEAETAWDDPSMDKARETWSSGRFREAAEMVARSLGTGPVGGTDGEIEAEVERRLASRAGASMVDSESTSSVVPTGVLTNASRLNDTLSGPSGREFWTEHKEEILKNLRGGKISLPA